MEDLGYALGNSVGLLEYHGFQVLEICLAQLIRIDDQGITKNSGFGH